MRENRSRRWALPWNSLQRASVNASESTTQFTSVRFVLSNFDFADRLRAGSWHLHSRDLWCIPGRCWARGRIYNFAV